MQEGQGEKLYEVGTPCYAVWCVIVKVSSAMSHNDVH